MAISGYDQELTCDRCTAIRTDFRARATLKLEGRSYVYPDNYPGTVKQREALRFVIRVDSGQMSIADVEMELAA